MKLDFSVSKFSFLSLIAALFSFICLEPPHFLSLFAAELNILSIISAVLAIFFGLKSLIELRQKLNLWDEFIAFLGILGGITVIVIHLVWLFMFKTILDVISK